MRSQGSKANWPCWWCVDPFMRKSYKPLIYHHLSSTKTITEKYFYLHIVLPMSHSNKTHHLSTNISTLTKIWSEIRQLKATMSVRVSVTGFGFENSVRERCTYKQKKLCSTVFMGWLPFSGERNLNMWEVSWGLKKMSVEEKNKFVYFNHDWVLHCLIFRFWVSRD